VREIRVAAGDGLKSRASQRENGCAERNASARRDAKDTSEYVVFYLDRRKRLKVSYNRESDVLLIQVSEAEVDYAEEMGPILFILQRMGACVAGDFGCE